MLPRFVLTLLCLLLAGGLAAQERGIGVRAKPAPAGVVTGTYRALIIGNNEYRDPRGKWSRLNTAINDARAVAAVLKDVYGFADVQLLENATRRDMIQAFNALAERAEEQDSVVVFYAGHGYLRESTDEGFWIPVDAEGADDSTFVPNAVIKTKVGILADRSRHVLIISDSCFSGALLREGNRGVALDERTERYYQKVAGRKSVQLLAAGGLEFVDDNYQGTGHSPFTYFLLKELRDTPESLIEATALSSQVVRNVSINVEQTPVSGVIHGAGHAGGEFFFVRGGQVAAQQEGFAKGAPADTAVAAIVPRQPAAPPPPPAGQSYRIFVAVTDYMDGAPLDQQIAGGELETLLLQARHTIVGSAGGKPMDEKQALAAARSKQADLVLVGRADARYSRELKIAEAFTMIFYNAFLQVRALRVNTGEVVLSERFDTLKAAGADTSAMGKTDSAIKSLKHVVNGHTGEIVTALRRVPQP